MGFCPHFVSWGGAGPEPHPSLPRLLWTFTLNTEATCTGWELRVHAPAALNPGAGAYLPQRLVRNVGLPREDGRGCLFLVGIILAVSWDGTWLKPPSSSCL